MCTSARNVNRRHRLQLQNPKRAAHSKITFIKVVTALHTQETTHNPRTMIAPIMNQWGTNRLLCGSAAAVFERDETRFNIKKHSGTKNNIPKATNTQNP